MLAPNGLIAAVLTLASAAAQSCTLRYAAEQWPPYVYRDISARVVGLDIDLAHAILAEAGCTLELQGETPVLRRESMFRSGKLDLLLAATDTPERRNYARFSLPYRQESVRVFALAVNAGHYGQLASFDAIVEQSLTLLAPSNGYYGVSYEQVRGTLKKQGRLSGFGSFEQGIRMLAAGRAQLIMGDDNAVRHAAHQAGLDVMPLPFSVHSAPVHLMLNSTSTSEQDLQRIDAAIARLEKRGILKAIRDEYGAR